MNDTSGLLGALEALWEPVVDVRAQPLRCFDLDLVATADGALLVGHPGDVPAQVWQALRDLGHSDESIRTGDAIGAHTLADIRSEMIGFSPDMSPAFDDVFAWLSGRLESLQPEERLRVLVAFEVKPRLTAPTLAVLLKVLEAAIVANAPGGHHLTKALALWYNVDLDSAALLLRHTRLVAGSELRSIYPVRDNHAEVEPGDGGGLNLADVLQGLGGNLSLLGPSIGLSEAFLLSIGAVHGLDAFAWVIDGVPQLLKAATARIRYVVSNRPMQLRKSIDLLLRERCGGGGIFTNHI